jgi:GNAT superfamily N-acetyltransferase
MAVEAEPSSREAGPAGAVARPAGAGDLKLLSDAFSSAVDELSGLRGGRHLITDLSGVAGVSLMVHAGRWKVLTEALARGFPTFWVGERGDEIVGFGWGRVAQHSDFGPLLGVVDLMYVMPDHRDVGVGKEILRVMQEWFESQGCKEMDANALPGDRETKNFYEESGFKARLLVMARAIGSAPTAGS